MSGRVTRKRARTGDASDSPLVVPDPPRQRDKEFWYDDGTIILIAGDIEFRIYKGILAEHSPVFSDMFSLPQPPEGTSASGDSPCPVVHVSDSPEDLRHVLRVYMPKSEPSPFTPDDPTFDAISATIRLGHKYQISRLVDHSLDYLRKYYPSDFVTWVKNNHLGPPSFRAIHAIGVINLARLTGETALLPAAFLVCCTLGAEIVEGVQREDGTCEQLSSADIGTLFVAKARLVQEAFENAAVVLAPPPPDSCQDLSRCRRRLLAFMNIMEDMSAIIAKKGPFVSVVETLWGSKKQDPALCRCCWATIVQRDVEQRYMLWDCLSDVLGLTEGTCIVADEEDDSSDGVDTD